MNSVTLVGRLTREPQLRYIAGSGMPVAQFTLAIDREFKKDGKKEVDFIDVQAWGKIAENCANYLGKGSMVGVQGSLRIENYLKDDEKRKSVKVNANSVQFLSSKNKDISNNYDPSQLDHKEFQAINDEELPF